MATKKISEFTTLGSLSDTDILPVVNAGSNKKITGATLKTYAQSGLTIPTDVSDLTDTTSLLGGGVGTLDSVTDTGSTTTNGITVGSVTLTNGAVIKDTAGDAVAFGQGAGTTSQGANSVAVGAGAGSNNQGYGGVAVGKGAGATGQGIDATAIGTDAGATDQGGDAVAVGESAGYTTQGGGAVAVGNYAGYNTQGTSAVAIGTDAGETNQGANAIAIGEQAGETTQGANAIAIGKDAGSNSQGRDAVAIGWDAGKTSQGDNAVAMGRLSGYNSQGAMAVAIGEQAGLTDQGQNAVAIGRDAGNTTQGTSAVAIGFLAGYTNQAANTIILNATDSVVNGVEAQTSSFYVAPIRTDATPANVLYYNTTTKEVTYGAGGGGSVSSLVNGDNELALGADGTLTLPSGGTITEGGGLSGAIRLTPAGGANANQALVIYPTVNPDGDHLHLTAGGGTTELYLGNDNQYVKVGKGAPYNGTIVIATTGWPDAVFDISSSGDWLGESLSNLATTGGTGTGLTVTVTQVAGVATAIAIVSGLMEGYTANDTITVTSGAATATFTISVLAPQWVFAPDGDLYIPTGKTIRDTGNGDDIRRIPGPYADDAAAAAASVAVGNPYHKTGTSGQVFVRLT